MLGREAAQRGSQSPAQFAFSRASCLLSGSLPWGDHRRAASAKEIALVACHCTQEEALSVAKRLNSVGQGGYSSRKTSRHEPPTMIAASYTHCFTSGCCRQADHTCRLGFFVVSGSFAGRFCWRHLARSNDATPRGISARLKANLIAADLQVAWPVSCLFAYMGVDQKVRNTWDDHWY